MSTPNDEKVPVFRQWRQWYWFVIALLVVQVVLFYLFTKHYA